MALSGEFDNLIFNTDNYKHCHYPLYPPGTEYISSYIESRGGEYPVTMFVGLQAFLNRTGFDGDIDDPEGLFSWRHRGSTPQS